MSANQDEAVSKLRSKLLVQKLGRQTRLSARMGAFRRHATNACLRHPRRENNLRSVKDVVLALKTPASLAAQFAGLCGARCGLCEEDGEQQFPVSARVLGFTEKAISEVEL